MPRLETLPTFGFMKQKAACSAWTDSRIATSWPRSVFRKRGSTLPTHDESVRPSKFLVFES
eukprot:scaffold21351_cov69-Cylindrotheca_fusiformis.AAC.1